MNMSFLSKHRFLAIKIKWFYNPFKPVHRYWWCICYWFSYTTNESNHQKYAELWL